MIASDIKKFLSGGPTASTPPNSLGGSISLSEIQNGTLQNLFNNVNAVERLAGSVKYRCFYIKNNLSDVNLTMAKIYIASQTTSATTSISIGLDPAGIGDGVTQGVATVIADEEIAPSGVTFSEPLNKNSALLLGNLASMKTAAIWIRRTIQPNTDPLPSDNSTLKIIGKPMRI